MALSTSERALRGRIGAYAQHAKHDPRKTTEAARASFLARFEAEVDPEGKLPTEERKRRAEYARKAYFAKLALASARARREQKERTSRSNSTRIEDKTAGGTAVESLEVRDDTATAPR